MKPTDDGLKQRLIGAVVLLALAVIFLPALFNREHLEPINSTTEIPPEPKIKTVSIDPPTRPNNIDLAPEPEVMYVPKDATSNKPSVSDKSEPIGLDSSGRVKSWVLQVASFRDAQHAKALAKKLLKSGYMAYTRKSHYKNSSVERVYVGPKLDKAELIRIQSKIDKAYDVTSMLVEFKAK